MMRRYLVTYEKPLEGEVEFEYYEPPLLANDIDLWNTSEKII